MLLPKLAFFALWDGTGDAFLVPRAKVSSPEAALPSGSYASEPAVTPADSLGTRPVTAADLAGPPSPRTEIKHKAYDPQYESSDWQPSCPQRQPGSPGTPDPDQGADGVGLDAPIRVRSDGSEPEQL